MDEETFRRARRLERGAVEGMLAEYYPMVNRVVLALVGREDVGGGVVRYVMRRSLKVLPKWEHGGDPGRWYGHHAIISARRASGHGGRAGGDTLGGPRPQARYVAFVKALRDLPHQQREGVILRECEGMDLRGVAVAMDCSTEAAGNHLQAGLGQLRLMAGEDYERLMGALRRTYAGLTPSEEFYLPAVKRYVGRHFWPRRIRRVIWGLVAVGVLAGVYWVAGRMGLVPEGYRILR